MQSDSSEPFRVIDFDLENRPLNYLAQDWTGAEITAMAWCEVGKPKTVRSLLLHPDGLYYPGGGVAVGLPPREAFELLCGVLMSAGLVTGHYIRKHDLPILNAACMEVGASPLGSLLTSDTQADFLRRKDLSASQENLAAMFGLPEPKHHMTQAEWRKANRLTPSGILAARKRVEDDVKQHMALRAELLKRKLLRAPKRWNP